MGNDNDLFDALGVTSITVEMRGGSESWSPLLGDESWEAFLARLRERYGRKGVGERRDYTPTASPVEEGASAFDF